ncbi:(2Fe-2S) ferredoxin domain-containing protein [Halalkalibacter oceani]|uniref:(2Fe-2S) ferredoxin domain-containing protein n=1 Tax=Halalkalibacter oceani TaxID=1653776 RepID=A0A9X2ING2_9BACI|nr:(2Fe-2S) ferredoxin domain-containing protein [Halalkalibacter oceani]MCM3713766.1 (2Fe-2S) ferredoxin domain-containing protein [Halalkalibacter oceani]
MTTWNLTGTEKHVLICNGSTCMKHGGEEVTQAVRDEISRLGLDEKIHTTRTRCNGRCKDACVLIVYPEGSWYAASSAEVGRAIIQRHLDPSIRLEGSLIYRFEEEKMTPAFTTERFRGIAKGKDKEKGEKQA